MPSRPHVALALLATAGTLCAVPATVAAAQPKDGGYTYRTNSTPPITIGIGTLKHKIAGAFIIAKFKKGGKLCTPPKAKVPGPTGVDLDLSKHPVKPSKSGSFDFKATGHVANGNSTKVKLQISGAFTSSTNAKIAVKASYGGCKASLSTKHAKFSQAG